MMKNNHKLKLIILVASVLLLTATAGFTGKSIKGQSIKTYSATTIQEETTQRLKTPANPASGEEINWEVISSGGTAGSSTNFQLAGTVGQTATGNGISTIYDIHHGYWQIFGSESCCNGDGIRGNVDDLSGPGGEVDVADLSYLVDFLFKGGPEPPCIDEGNVDGIEGPGGPIDVADLSYLVDYLFKGGSLPPVCP
jgi:hypothetical protein